MVFNDREVIIQLTPQWKGERFPDGRPRVPDRIIERLRTMTMEEAWKPIWLKGYDFNFQGDLKALHSGKLLIGRAVTATFMPTRPDLHETLFNLGHEQGFQGNYNQWVISTLQPGDVLVVDMYDKIYKGTFLGGNLTTAVKQKTINGGALIWGGVRDMQQMSKVEDVQVLYRGVDVTPIRECLMTGINVPCRIGRAVCLPGDIVYGNENGVLFIPAHLAEEVVDGAEKAHVRDIVGFEMIASGKATVAEIDRPWTANMLRMLQRFVLEDERGKEYSHLSWEREIAEAEKMEYDASVSEA